MKHHLVSTVFFSFCRPSRAGFFPISTGFYRVFYSFLWFERVHRVHRVHRVSASVHRTAFHLVTSRRRRLIRVDDAIVPFPSRVFLLFLFLFYREFRRWPITEFYWVSLGCTWFCRLLPSFTGFYRVIPRFIRSYSVVS